MNTKFIRFRKHIIPVDNISYISPTELTIRIYYKQPKGGCYTIFNFNSKKDRETATDALTTVLNAQSILPE